MILKKPCGIKWLISGETYMKIEISEDYLPLTRAIQNIENQIKQHLLSLGFKGSVFIRETDNKNIFYLVVDDGKVHKEYRLGNFVKQQKQHLYDHEISFSSIASQGPFDIRQIGKQCYLISVSNPYIVYRITRVTDGEPRTSADNLYSDDVHDLDDILFDGIDNCIKQISKTFGISYKQI